MKKMRSSIRGVPLLILAAILIVVPLLGVACSDDNGGTTATAKFSASPESGLGPLTVTFTDQSEGDIASWAWDFDDDGVTDSTDQNPSHTFTGSDLSDLIAQEYTVVLTVTDADGATDQAETTIAVTPDYPDMTLVLSYVTAPAVTMSKPVEKFAELLELYTGGAVQVQVHGGGTLLTHGEDWVAVKDGSMVDIIQTTPYLLALFDINMNPYCPYQFLVTTVEHGRAMNEDGRVNEIVDGLLAESGVKLLGYIPSVLMACNLTSVRELKSYADLHGLRFGSLYPGLLNPFQEYYGVTEVYVGADGELMGLINDIFDCSATELSHAIQTGLLDYHKHAILTEVYMPNILLMNMDAWDSLGADLQSLINDVIMPEVIAYAEEVTLDELKECVKTFADELDTVHVLTPAQGLAMVEEVMASDTHAGDRLREMHDDLMPEILEIIEELRPADLQLSPEIIEILDYAGVEY